MGISNKISALDLMVGIGGDPGVHPAADSETGYDGTRITRQVLASANINVAC